MLEKPKRLLLLSVADSFYYEKGDSFRCVLVGEVLPGSHLVSFLARSQLSLNTGDAFCPIGLQKHVSDQQHLTQLDRHGP